MTVVFWIGWTQEERDAVMLDGLAALCLHEIEDYVGHDRDTDYRAPWAISEG